MMKTLLILVSTVGITGLTALPAWAQSAPSPANLAWKAGAVSVPITPAKNLWMAGYAARKKPAEGKTQDLFAKALALEDPTGTRLVILTMDLIGVPQPLRQRVAERAQKDFKLRPDYLLLNASHTHSGPSLHSEPLTEKDQANERVRLAGEYTRELEDKLVQAIGDALGKLEPARLSWNRARCGFAMNRRLPTPTGYKNSPNPDGPVDHEVPALRVEGAGGQLLAAMFGYACHNTCLGGYTYCGDYAGYAQEYLQANRPGFVALFLMGCSADQNPYPRRSDVVPGVSDIELTQQHGRTLANAVEVALGVPPRELRGPLRAAYGEVQLEYAKDRPPHAYSVQVVRFGSDLTLVALGGEVVVDYSLRLKKELAGPAAVWVAGYSNDSCGYIPSLRVLKEGGYEAQTGWAESVEERIVGKVRELLERTEAPK